ncbi:extracellular solute-binding protein [Azomonas agilis]|uniref:Extracellular solute-binding protein n=1 Tax=Azomonas agilis TaxID=116849 RepID=A0A562ILL6_9GAMM|nr:ABC transporter substrate-binding protein [Azomonas agilis]TWH71494.1 extracellular solute-binding protein [Azomonas agilis]
MTAYCYLDPQAADTGLESLEYEEPVFPEEQGAAPRQLDFYGHSIPPLERTLRRQLARYFITQGLQPDWYIPLPSNAQPYQDFRHTQRREELPCLIAAGPRHFAQPDFRQRWANVFAPLPSIPMRPELISAEFADPEDLFRVYGSACWIMLLDRERLGSRPEPKGWADLFNPRYQGEIILNGEQGLPNAMLLGNLAKDFGPAALETLGRNTKAIQGGGEMARAAGSRHPQRAAIYVLPWFWAENNIHSERTARLWPEEGAYGSPLTLLGQKHLSPGAQAAFDFLTGPRWARQMEDIHCIAAHRQHARLPLPGPLRWIGWDLARSNQLDALLAQAGHSFKRGYQA